jgi:hypothetical protein
MIRKESYVLRKSEENEEREKREVTEGESCASPVVSPCEHFVSISS